MGEPETGGKFKCIIASEGWTPLEIASQKSMNQFKQGRCQTFWVFNISESGDGCIEFGRIFYNFSPL